MFDHTIEHLRATDAVMRALRDLYPPMPLPPVATALVNVLCALMAVSPLGIGAFPNEDVLAKHLKDKVEFFRKHPERSPIKKSAPL